MSYGQNLFTSADWGTPRDFQVARPIRLQIAKVHFGSVHDALHQWHMMACMCVLCAVLDT